MYRSIGSLALVLLFMALAHTPLWGEGNPETVVIIVHPESDIRNLDLTSIQRLFRGQLVTNRDLLQKKEVASLYRIRLFIQAQAEKPFLSRYLQTSSRAFWRNWTGRLLSGENIAAPKKLNKGSRVIDLVSEDETALAVVLSTEVTENVRVLPIAGIDVTN